MKFILNTRQCINRKKKKRREKKKGEDEAACEDFKEECLNVEASIRIFNPAECRPHDRDGQNTMMKLQMKGEVLIQCRGYASTEIR